MSTTIQQPRPGWPIVCDECPRSRKGTRVKRLRLRGPVRADPDRCLLEEGLVCCGPVTRAGCGGFCPRTHSPCIGCFGHPEGAEAFVPAAIRMLAEHTTRRDPEPVERLKRAGLADPVGMLCALRLSHAALRRRVLRWRAASA